MNQARTGTDNRTFNLVSVLYHSLESAATNEKYLRDAQGDRECEEFFREIEALAESGITLGCTATTFCPDATLTRRQMAAFLARALGLYWQY